MTANQYRAALKKLALTQVRAARLLGVNEATSRRWARHGVTGTTELLLEMLTHGDTSIGAIERAKSRLARSEAAHGR